MNHISEYDVIGVTANDGVPTFVCMNFYQEEIKEPRYFIDRQAVYDAEREVREIELNRKFWKAKYVDLQREYQRLIDEMKDLKKAIRA